MKIKKNAPVAGRFLTERDKQILKALATHGLMTREHVRALFFRDGASLRSVQAASRRLKRLTAAGLLARVRLPSPSGSGPFVYHLSKHGLEIAAQGSMRKVFTGSPAGLLHGLEQMDFYVALKTALDKSGGAILRWLGESEAKYVFGSGARRITMSPDAYCEWAIGDEEGAFFLEIDRGTESLARIREKLERYEAYYKRRAYLQHLGETLRPRLIFVVPEQERAERVCRWLLANRGAFHHLPTIMVGKRKAVLDDALEAIWLVPGQTEQQRLND